MASSAFPSPAVGLDDLLAGIARGLANAQGQLDAAARSAPETVVPAGDHELSLRPLWFVFQRTTIELEFSTFAGSGGSAAQIQCRPLDPIALALRADARALGARLRVEIAPVGAEILRKQE
jgi:hypothetical protein